MAASARAAQRVAPLLLDWWTRHGRRNLPWQRDPTPYRVWISEIMLQQTQVATVERYYDRFLAAFPDVTALAAAEQDAVLHLWSGLGYYARARNLHRAARIIVDEHGGELPASIEALQALPGIGRSTAGAILALALDRSYPILDGNAKRVLARFFGVDGWPGSSPVNRRLWELAEACTPGERAAQFTQAVMDLGSTVCTRRSPGCAGCPLRQHCVAHGSKRTADIPAARPKRVRPQKKTVFVVMRRGDGSVLLRKRPDEGVWGGLWCFPETSGVDSVAQWCLRHAGRPPERLDVRPALHHSFTHFDLEMTPVEAFVAKPDNLAMDDDRSLWYKLDEPSVVGLARPVSRLLESLRRN